MYSAFDEVLQALDGLSVLRFMKRPFEGTLADYYGGKRLHLVRGLLKDSKGPNSPRTLHDVETATRNANLIYYSATSKIPGSGLVFTKVVSPNLLPYALPGKGRRVVHPVLQAELAADGRSVEDLTAEPHPLG